MPGMPGNITKGPILKALDDHVNTAPGALDLLTYYYGESEMEQWISEGEDQGILRKKFGRKDKGGNATKAPLEDDADHVKRHWFGIGLKKARTAWWPDHTMSDVFQEGLKQALRLCLDDPEPMETGPLSFASGGGTHSITRSDGQNWSDDGVADGHQLHFWGAAEEKNNGKKTVSGGSGTDTIEVDEECATEPTDPGDPNPARAYRPLANSNKLDSFWLCSGDHYELVSCLNTDTKCVTFLICTPKPPMTRTRGYFGDPLTHDADRDPIWVTKASVTAGEGEIIRPMPGKKRNAAVVNVQLAVQDILDSYDL